MPSIITSPAARDTRPTSPAGAVATGAIEWRSHDTEIAVRPKSTSPTPVATAPAGLVGLVSRAAGEVMIDGIRANDPFDRELRAGNMLATSDGRVDVQFGEASAFALGPRSKLELRRFDASMIELVVDGTIDVEVAARAADQRFIVVAGEHTVEVRGTQFRVVRDSHGTEVACRHGMVTVGDANDFVVVGASRKIAIAPGAAVKASKVVAMTLDDAASVAQATPVAMPAWTSDLARAYQPLDILTAGRHDVRVDGIELGAAPLRVRVTPGRHTVEVADGSRRFRRAGWVDVGTKPARLEVPAEVGPSTGIADRRRELAASLDHARLRLCTRTLAKQGLSAHLDFSISVTAAGDVGFLNINDTDLSKTDADCVEAVLRDVRFHAGAAATWHQRLDL
jgi:hypothetical protein